MDKLWPAIRSLFAPERRENLEYLDQPLVQDDSISIDELDRNMRQMRGLDEAFGGLSLLLRGVEEVMGSRYTDHPHPNPLPSRDREPGTRISIIDVGTGAASVPLALAEWAAGRGVRAEAVGLDNSRKALAVAARSIGNQPLIRLVAGDARALPFADGSFDVAVTTLTLHHCSPEDAVQLLRELQRVSRRGFVVVDLTRSRILWVLLWGLTRLAPGNRLTHHDGPVSALRAYSPSEVRELAARAGVEVRMTRRLFRMAIVCKRDDPD